MAVYEFNSTDIVGEKMRNYILKIICSLTIISVIGFSGVSIFSNKVVYAEEITTITNDEE